MKVLIVGAGPSGLTAAIELARNGIKPTIVDRRHNASTLSRAVGITPRSLELLSHSGAHKPLIDEGITMDGLRVYHGRKLCLAMDLWSDQAFHPNLVCLAQNRTEEILAKTLAKFGVSVSYGVKFEELEQTANGLVARLDKYEEETFDHIIGADGIRSTVREQAGIEFQGFDLKEKWAVADVDLINWRHPGCLTVVQAGKGLVVVVVPIGDGRFRVVSSSENALDVMPLELKVKKVRREGSFTISVRMADTYSTGNIHLVGDAAHAHSPVGGRGMNLGISDAVELARRMINGDLVGYTHARQSEALEAKAITERGRKMSTGPNLGRRIAFRGLVMGARMSPSIRKRIGSFIVEF